MPVTKAGFDLFPAAACWISAVAKKLRRDKSERAWPKETADSGSEFQVFNVLRATGKGRQGPIGRMGVADAFARLQLLPLIRCGYSGGPGQGF